MCIMHDKEIIIFTADFFNRDAVLVAKDLLGKILCHKAGKLWRKARIIETEAYYMHEKGSHASLGFSPSRKALFMSPGTIYMYYARGKDSFNVSCLGEGNAVLFKSGYAADINESETIANMQADNPVNNRPREVHRLCSGQTLLCKSLGLKLQDWCCRPFDNDRLLLLSDGYVPSAIVTAVRLGIPQGRDEHLPLRFYDKAYAKYTTQGR